MDSKNPIKWVGLGVWLVGIWFAWEYNSEPTEFVCPNGLPTCPWGTKIGVPVKVSDLALNMVLASTLITVIAGVIVSVLIEKTEAHFTHQQAKDQREMDAYNLNSQDYAERPLLIGDGNSEDLADLIYEQQVIETLDVSGAADKYDVSEATIRKWLGEGELDGYKNGNRWVIPVFSDEELSVKEASELFGVSAAKIRSWLNEGEICGYKNDSGQWRVYAPD